MRKRKRDTTPDELEKLEEEIVHHSDELRPDSRPASEPEMGREIDRDRDGLPDRPAKWRVPS